MEDNQVVDNLQEEIVSDAETTADSNSPIENETEESNEVSNNAVSDSQTGDQEDNAELAPKSQGRFKELVDRTKYLDETNSKLQQQVDELRKYQSQQNYGGYDQYGQPLRPQIDVRDIEMQILKEQLSIDKRETLMDKLESKNPLLNPDNASFSKAALDDFHLAVYKKGVDPEVASSLLEKSFEVGRSIAGSQSRQAIAQKQSVKPVKASAAPANGFPKNGSFEEMRRYLLEHPDDE